MTYEFREAAVKLACLVLLISPVFGAATFADLSGEWRWTGSDDPRYSQPAFDDQTWPTVSVPRVRLRSRDWSDSDYLWIRRTVVVNPTSDEPLALTVGALQEAYEVFVNGVRVGATGPFDYRSLQVARPRTFVLPPEVHGPRLVIAIRMWNPILPGWRGLLLNDTGPWLLTPANLAPRDIGLAAIDRRRVDRTADLVQSVIALVLSVIVLLIWAYDRSRKELLWLGLYLVLVGGSRFHNYTLLNLDSHPFWQSHWKQFVVMAILPAALLAQFAAASLNIRWIVTPTWITVLAGIAGVAWNGVGRDFDPTVWVIDLFTLAGLVLACRPGSHTGFWRGTPRLALAASIAFCLYTHASGWGRIEKLGLPVLSLIQGPFAFSAHMMTLTVLSFGFALVLVRRLLRDRDEKVRLTGELEAARSVQQLLLPAAGVVSRHYETHAIYEPAQEVGGDFYWSRITADEGLLLVVGDVSGKGLKAAMLVSVAVGLLRNEKSDSPAQILSALNESLVGNTGGGFVTCCCARLDPDGKVTVANAGHLAPYADGREMDVEPGLPLGLVDRAGYIESSLLLDGQFTLMSDGVAEAENAQRELFGFDRTRTISTKPAKEIAEAAKAWGQNDDITVVTVRRVA